MAKASCAFRRHHVQLGAKGGFDPQQSREARIPQSAFDLGVRRPIHSCPRGEVFLCEAGSLACCPQPDTERRSELAELGGVGRWGGQWHAGHARVIMVESL